MRYLISIMLLFTMLTTANGQVANTSLVARSNVAIVQIDRKAFASSEQPAGLNFSSQIPQRLAEIIQEKTEIPCDSISVGCIVGTEDDSFGKAVIGGDGFARKGELNFGGKKLKHDYSCKFRRIFEFSNEDSFVAEGAFEFKNNLSNKTSYLVCRMNGQRNDDGKVVGDCQWIGPIDMGNVASTSMSLPTIFDDKSPTKK